MADVNQPPMPRAIVDAQGRPTEEFGIWMQQLWLRTGGGTDRFDPLENDPAFLGFALGQREVEEQFPAIARQRSEDAPYLPQVGWQTPDEAFMPLPGLRMQSGSWTPVIYGSTTAGTNTYTTQEGYWRRIGDLCWVYGAVYIDTIDGTIAGGVRISGLPFAAVIDQSIIYTEWTSVNVAASQYYISGLVLDGENFLRVRVSGDNFAAANLGVATITSGSGFTLTGWYLAQ